MICPKCGSENTFDDWDNPDDHGLIINHNWKCRDCGWDDKKKTMTNGDKIRVMSDEELAQFIHKKYDCCRTCPALQHCHDEDVDGRECIETIMGWLKQEAKDE